MVLTPSPRTQCLSTHFVLIAQFSMAVIKTLVDREIVPKLNNIATTSTGVENHVVLKNRNASIERKYVC